MFHADNAYYLPAATIVTQAAEDPHRLEHRLPRLRRAAGDDGVERVIDAIAWALGLDPLDVRKRNLYGAGRDVTPYRHDGRGQYRCRELIDDAARRRATIARAAQAIAAFNARAPILKKGLALTPVKFGISLHHHPSQPGRRAGACLSRRLDPPEPWRHRDGAGAVHQGRAGGGGGIRRRLEQVKITATTHRQGAEHLGDRGLLRLRPQRHGGEERRAARSRSGWTRSRPRVTTSTPTRSNSATTACSSATSSVPSPSWSARPISRASRCRRPASTRRRRSTGTAPSSAGPARSSISPMARRARRC